MSTANNNGGLKWTLPHQKASRSQPVPPNTTPQEVHKRKELFGLVTKQQDQDYEDDVHGIYQDVDKARRISVGMAHITDFGNAISQATTQKIEDDARSYDEDSLAGQLGARQAPEASAELEAFNKQLRQAVGDNMLRRTQTER